MANLVSDGVTNGSYVTPRAWVNFNSGGGIRSSYNVSSISVFAAGNYGINFSSALSAGYAFSLSGQERNDSGARPDFLCDAYTSGDPGTSQFRVITHFVSNFNSYYSPNQVCAICFR